MFTLQPKFFENPPKKDTYIPDINPETSFQVVVNFWNQALETFPQEDKERLMCNLERLFLPLDDSPKKKLLENLLLLINFVEQN